MKTKISKRVLGTRIGKNFEISPCVVMGIWKTNLFHGSSSNLREVHPLKFIEGYGAVFHKTMTGPATRFSIPHNADPCHPLSSHIATNLYFLSPSRSSLLCSQSRCFVSYSISARSWWNNAWEWAYVITTMNLNWFLTKYLKRNGFIVRYFTMALSSTRYIRNLL